MRVITLGDSGLEMNQEGGDCTRDGEIGGGSKREDSKTGQYVVSGEGKNFIIIASDRS